MKSYTYSEARRNLATMLDEAARDGAVEIRRRDGSLFRILPLRKSNASLLDVKGVKVGVSSADLVAIVREGRGHRRVLPGRKTGRDLGTPRSIFPFCRAVPD